jgi:hypothetical protein
MLAPGLKRSMVIQFICFPTAWSISDGLTDPI